MKAEMCKHICSPKETRRELIVLLQICQSTKHTLKEKKKKKVSLGIFAMKTSQSFWKESKIISMTIWLNLLNVVVSLFPKD